MPQPFISVVIPVWNSPDLIRKCLAAIEAQTYPRDRFEVLVVDNGSTDGTADVVREFPWARLLSEPAPGSYRARNLGIRSANGEYVAFTDADCIPDTGWLAAAAAAARPERALLAGRIDLFRVGEGGRASCENYERLFAFNQQKNVRNGVAVTANWMSPRGLLEELGGFNADLKSGGDYDLSSRISRSGRDIAYVDDMRVQHPVRTGISELAAKTRRVTGGRFTGRKPLGGPLGWLVLLGADCLRRFKVVAQSSLKPGEKLGVAGIAVLIYGVAMGEVIRLTFGGTTARQ